MSKQTTELLMPMKKRAPKSVQQYQPRGRELRATTIRLTAKQAAVVDRAALEDKRTRSGYAALVLYRQAVRDLTRPGIDVEEIEKNAEKFSGDGNYTH
jgi:phosphate uptake regulator